MTKMRQLILSCAVGGLLALPHGSKLLAEDNRAAAHQMAQRIDELLETRWRSERVEPAADAGDAQFMRRVYLDLTGVVPTAAEARRFLVATDEDKRARLIEELLVSPAFATHLASRWRAIMLPNGFDAEQVNNAVGLQSWLREQFVNNMRYDRIVADFLVSEGGDEIGPALFYTSQELQPEKLAASTARIFLGLQIECAQCHAHPFDRWTQRDFWGYVAFFARLEQTQDMQRGGNVVRLVDVRAGEVTIPDTDLTVAPAYPAAQTVPDPEFGSRRMQLAIWMASRDNPYLAKAAVNRVWSQLFGRGIVEPVDDIGPHNPASHPDLLDELAEHFARSQFDLRQLYRTLANTRAYQRSSIGLDHASQRPELFAQMAVKPLTPEQLYDSLNQTLGRPLSTTQPGSRAASRLLDQQRLLFVSKMGTTTGSATEFQAGVPQALTLMNGLEMAMATDPAQGRLLAALEAPYLSDSQRVEAIFLATVSRFPTDEERSLFLEYVEAAGDRKSRRTALSDMLWALLNSSEFALNH